MPAVGVRSESLLSVPGRGHIEEQPVLLSVAAISLSIAGFSSVAIAIRHRDPGEWPLHLRLRLQSLVDIGMTALGLALLPIALHYLGVGQDALWHVASLVLAIAVTLLTIRIVTRSRSSTQTGAMGRWYPPLSLGLAVIVVVGNLANVVLDLGMPTSFGIYLASLFSMVGVAGTMFVRLIALPLGEQR